MLAINTEDEVRMSDLILQMDIQTLAKSNSQLLDDAIALRYAQMEQRRNPDDKACCPRIAACPDTRAWEREGRRVHMKRGTAG